MVIVFDAQEAVTPGGRPVPVPTPVAPVVVWVRRVNAVFTHKVGMLDAEDTVLVGTTVLEATIVIVPVADAVPQPPVRGMS